MARILLFIAFVFLIWFAVRALGAARKRGDDAEPDAGRVAAPSASTGIETISQCAWCGVHVPRGAALSLPDGRIYCTEAHRDAAHAAITPIDRSRS